MIHYPWLTTVPANDQATPTLENFWCIWQPGIIEVNTWIWTGC